MVVRTGSKTGRKFWGCVNFPRCRGTRTIRRKRIKGYRDVVERLKGEKIGKDCDVHHIDGDPSNNQPDNLLVIDRMNHRELHKCVKRWKGNVKRGTELYNEIKLMEERLK